MRNPIDLETFAVTGAENAGGRTILTIGRLAEQKAHDVVLRAFADMGDAGKQWRLAIVGEGPLDVGFQRIEGVAEEPLGRRQSHNHQVLGSGVTRE